MKNLRNSRIISIYSDRDFARPLITAWVASTVHACCAFILIAGVFRLGSLGLMVSLGERFFLVLPMTLAGCVVATIPKLTVFSTYIHWFGRPLAGLDDYGWNAKQAVGEMMWEMSFVVWFSWIYTFATVFSLAAMSGAVRFVSIRNPVAKALARKTSRVTLWSLPVALVVWFALSILIFEPIHFVQNPDLFGPYHLFDDWLLGIQKN